MKIKNNLNYSIISFVIINNNFGPEIEIYPGDEKEILLPSEHSVFDENFQKEIESLKILCWNLENEPSDENSVGYYKKRIVDYTQIAQEFSVGGFDFLVVSVRNSKDPYLSPAQYSWNFDNDPDE
ncbi:MAG TPA: hypothetical protein PK686_00005 [bacterium]|nr:hypothetical protein [bacterium]HPV65051.1 hypothetical protein [bacterium]